MTGRSRTNSARRWATASTAATIAWRCARGTASPMPRRANRAFLPRAELAAPRLADLLALDDAAFREMFAGSPIKRIGVKRMIRNCLIAAGNSGDRRLGRHRCAPHLDDPDPVIAEAAQWALGSARLFERGDAGRLIDSRRPTASRVSTWVTRRHIVLRIEIGVEDAVAAAELELEAGAFADLQRRVAEMADQILRGEADDAARLARRAAAAAAAASGGCCGAVAQPASNRVEARMNMRRMA